MLEVSDLKCVRGERPLFDGVGFRLGSGQLLYVRGANGAGKTSMLRLLCGLSPAESGQILWDGVPIHELGELYRQDLFYLGHHNALQEALTVGENLAFYANLAGTRPSEADIAHALSRIGLRPCQSKLVRHLSQGQKRRVALSRLMLNRARLWILDEPFVALDVAAITLLADLVAAHLAQGGLAVFTSHQEVAIGTAPPQILELGA
ncbi:MAG: cytochrome c biogenesis heme-transporting ATPase CcmA [Rhodoferax sp.]|jgi:heme exporter protein A|nr:cytochrome c biogenesis heme-transporting ATPase CcmA [Rhodoferax sp.]MBP9060238.1 cytochrome c biogenesis heme-transporting ATPase CcmA [Rhodoferax sp.]MBP9685130.1 cytochrome c biogenesis heme-transporting ATPase CcmA [Rhodoferax sp.]